MSVISDAAQPRGDVMRRLAEIERQMQSLRTARRLEAASVGRGGVRVKGGRIVIEDEDGNETFVAASDGLALIGSLDVLQGGNIVAHHPDDSQGVILGLFDVGGGGILNRGISVQTDDSVPGTGIFENANIFAAWQRSDGGRQVHVGELNNPVEELNCRTVQTFLDATSSFAMTGAGQFFIDVDGDFVAAAGGQAGVVAAGQVTIRSGSVAGLILGLDPPGDFGIQIASTGLFVSTSDTTGSPANVHMDGFGRVSVITSAARNKVDLQDLVVDPREVLNLRPRTWRDRAEVERNPDTDRWHVGLVAEEVDAAGLHEFVDYDERGNPESVAYDRLVVALLEVVREQEDRLDALDGGTERQPATGRKPRRRRDASAQPPPPPLAPPQSPPRR